MKHLYSLKTGALILSFFTAIYSSAQSPTLTTQGTCNGVVANFNTNDNGFNSPSIYGSIFDSSFYYNASRGYFTDYSPPTRTNAPGFPRVMNIISPPYNNPNPTGTFNVGFYYIVNQPNVDRFQVRIISLTQTPNGTVTNVEATSGVQFFSTWSTPTPYVDNGPQPTPLLNGFEGFVCIRLIDPDINNANTTFRVEVSYLINEAFFAVFDNLSIGPLNTPLPVNFIGLVANRNTNDNSVSLKWDVGEEVNVKEYQVERSDNGTNYTTVGTVSVKGKSIYTLTNADVPATTVFYRVKSVDNDGRYKYSGIVKLNGGSSTSYADKLSAYPVPVKDEITLSHKKLSRNARITITSLDGKVMKVITPAQGSSNTMTNLSGFTPGMYFIRLEDEKGMVEVVKVIKN